MRKWLVSLVNIPAKAVYIAMNAVMMPKTPPALVALSEGASSPAASNQKVMSRQPKSETRAMEDRSEAMKKSRVTSAQEMR
jgi:hypothetical protein